MDPILINLIANVVVPEVIDMIKNYHAQHDGQWPTGAEVLAALPSVANMHADAGDEFLHRHDKPVTKPKKRRKKTDD